MKIVFEHFLKNTAQIALTIVFPSSLLIEDKENNGITHLLEHLHYRGSSQLPQMKLYSDMEILDAPICGVTTNQSMSFSFSSSKNHFIEAFDLFCRFLFEVHWTSLDFLQEKAVVRREIEEKRTDSFTLRFKKFLFGNIPYSLSIMGNLSKISSVSSDSVLLWKEKVETLQNAYCFLSGAIEDKSLCNYVSKKLSYGLKQQKMSSISVLPNFRIPNRRYQCVRPRWNDENEIAVALFFPKSKCSFFEFEIFRSALCGGDGALLLRNLRERDALCTGISECVYYHQDYYILTFSCIVKHNSVTLAFSDILEALKYMKNYFNKTDFLQAIAPYRLNFDRFEENPSVWNEFLFDYFEATGCFDVSKEQIKEGFAQLTEKDILHTAQFVIHPINIAIFAETYQEKCIKNFYSQLNLSS